MEANTEALQMGTPLTVCLGQSLGAVGPAIGTHLRGGLHIPSGGVRLRQGHRVEAELVGGTGRVPHLLGLEALEVLVQQDVPMAGGQRILAAVPGQGAASITVSVRFRHWVWVVPVEVAQSRLAQLVEMGPDLLLALAILGLLPLQKIRG